MTPTNGMTVLFQPPKGADQPPRPQLCAAIVCSVINDREINLIWFDETGTPSTASNVQLVQDGDTPNPTGYYAQFPA